MTKLEWALAHARRGWNVFPVPPNSKKPHKEGEGPIRFGVTSATNAETQIRSWWGEWPDANIAGTGFLVLDCDTKEGVDGLLNLDLYCAEHGIELPETLEFRSQGGGVHLVYDPDPEQPFGQGDVAEGVNVRAPGMGYILLPGSTIDGRAYAIKEKRPVVRVPRKIQAASAVAKRERADTSIEGELDHPLALARARDYMEGAGGELMRTNPGAYEVAARLMDWGISPPMVEELGLPYCQQSWVPEWRQLVYNVMSYRQNSIGGKGTAGGAPSSELLRIAETIGKSIADAIRPPEQRRTFALLRWGEATEPMEYAELVADLIPDKEFGVLYGKWGSYKTFIAVHIACNWSVGRPVFGRESFEASPVLYIAGENATSVRLRLSAWRQKYGDARVDVIPQPVRLNEPGEVEALIDQVRDNGYRMVIVDTLAKCTPGMDDTSTEASSLLLLAAETMCRTLGVTVIGVGHEGKNDSGTLRGSSNTEAGSTFLFRAEKINGKGKPLAKVTVYKNKDDSDGESFYLEGQEQDTGWRKKHRAENTKSLVFEIAEAQHDQGAAETYAEVARRREWVERLLVLGAHRGQDVTYAQLAKALDIRKETLRQQFCRGGKRFTVGPDLQQGLPGYTIYTEIGPGGCDVIRMSQVSQANEETGEN